jgi:hypothetical protein
VAAHRGVSWVITSGDNRLWRADGDNLRIVQTITLPGPPVAVTADDTAVYVALSNPASIIRFDPLSLENLTTTPLPGLPVDLTTNGRNVLAIIRPFPTNTRPLPE